MEDVKEVGRPSDYTQEMAINICEDISTGKSLRAVCRDPNRPSIATVYKWMRDYPEFLKQYEVSTNERADYQMEELNDIGDEAVMYAKTNEDKNVSAVVSAYKLKADNMRWAMSKIKPKKYGDKLDMTSAGEQLQNTILVKFDDK